MLYTSEGMLCRIAVQYLTIWLIYADTDKDHEPYAEANRMLERNIQHIPLSSVEEPDEVCLIFITKHR